MAQPTKRTGLQRALRVWVVVGVLFLLGVALLARATGGYDLSWWSADGGGATGAGAGSYRLSGTAGQPDAGLLAGGGYRLLGGLWDDVVTAAQGARVYLPVVLRRW